MVEKQLRPEAADAPACLPPPSATLLALKSQADAGLWPRLSREGEGVSIRKLCLQLCVMESQMTALNFSLRGCVLKRGWLTAPTLQREGAGQPAPGRGWPSSFGGRFALHRRRLLGCRHSLPRPQRATWLGTWTLVPIPPCVHGLTLVACRFSAHGWDGCPGLRALCASPVCQPGCGALSRGAPRGTLSVRP